MSCKTILTVVTPHDRSSDELRAFDAATALARQQDAHLEVLAIGLDETPYGYFYADASLAILNAGPEKACRDAGNIDARVRERLSAEDIRWSCEQTVTQLGSLPAVVALRARFADYVVVNRPYGDGRTTADVAVLEAALFDADVPVLVLPPDLHEIPQARRVVIAWNGSPEALAAIRAALPLLRRAEHVNIAIIDPPSEGPEAAEPGASLAQWLARHHVKAEISVLARSLPRVSDMLQRHLRETNADLLVMGAYGHSRFREAILGGATRDLLERAEVTVFMAR